MTATSLLIKIEQLRERRANAKTYEEQDHYNALLSKLYEKWYIMIEQDPTIIGGVKC